VLLFYSLFIESKKRRRKACNFLFKSTEKI
jgi:hypothetical protein